MDYFQVIIYYLPALSWDAILNITKVLFLITKDSFQIQPCIFSLEKI